MRILELKQRLRAAGAGPSHEQRILRLWSHALPRDSGRRLPASFFPSSLMAALPTIEAELASARAAYSAAQVHGGVSMSIGYALAEQMLFDEQTGKPLNNNLLDYKLPTIMDTPVITAAFVEPYEPTGPFGNKSLGEPPVITPAPAIRNAVLHATGVAFSRLPMNPQRVFEKFKEAGLI